MPDYSEYDDEALFAQFLAEGDSLALNHLFERYIVPVASVCSRMLPPHLAEEAAQDTFLSAVRYARSFKRSHRFKAWLLTIAVHASQRKMKRERRARSVAMQEVVANDQSGVATAPEHAQMHLEINRTMENFSQEQRAALVLHYGLSLTRVEVADALQRPEGTVASWLRSGMQRLRERLKQRGFEPNEAVFCAGLLALPESLKLYSVREAALCATRQKPPAPLSTKLAVSGAAIVVLLVLAWQIRDTPAVALAKISNQLPVQPTGGEKIPAAPVVTPGATLVTQTGFSGQTASYRSFAVSPNGDWMAIWSHIEEELTLRRTSVPEKVVYRMSGYISAAKFSSDNRELVILDTWPRTVVTHLSLENFKTVAHTLKTNLMAQQVSLMPNRKCLVCCGHSVGPLVYLDPQKRKGNVVVYNYEQETAEIVLTYAADNANASNADTERLVVEVLSDTRLAVAGSRGGRTLPVTIYELGAAEALQVFSVAQSKPAAPEFLQLRASRNGSRLAVVSTTGRQDKVTLGLQVLDTNKGVSIAARNWEAPRSDPSAPLLYGSVIPNDDHAILGQQNGLVRWDFLTQQEPQRVARLENLKDQSALYAINTDRLFATHGNLLTMCDVSRNTQSVMNLSGDFGNSSVSKSISSSGGRLLATLPNITSQFTPTIALWDLATARMIGQTTLPMEKTHKIALASFGEDGNLYVAGASAQRTKEARITWWKVERFVLGTGKRERLFPASDPLEGRCKIWDSACFAMNERWAALNTGDSLRRFDLRTGKELPALAFPAGTPVVDSPSVKLQPGRDEANAAGIESNLATGGARAVPKGEYDVVISPDGRWMSSYDLTLQASCLYSWPARKLVAKFQSGESIQFDSACGNAILYANDGVFRVHLADWDAHKKPFRDVLEKLPGAEFKNGQFRTSCFLPGLKGMIIRTADGFSLRDPISGQDLAYFRAYENKEWIVYTPDGLFTGSSQIEKAISFQLEGKDITSANELAARRQHDVIQARIRPFILKPDEYPNAIQLPPAEKIIETPVNAAKAPGDF